MWSSGAVFAKIGLKYASIWSFLFLRSTVAITLLLTVIAILFLKGYLKKQTFQNSDMTKVISSGILLQIGYLTAYFYAIETEISLSLIILILGLQPILTMLFNIANITKFEWILVLGSFIGLLISVSGFYSIGYLNLLGVFFSILALISITWGTIIQSKIKSSVLYTLSIQVAISWVIFLFILIFKDFQVTWDPEFIISLLWMGVVVSIGALMLLMFMLKNNSAQKVSMLFFLLPLMTILLDVLIFDAHLNLISIVGALIVCTCVFFYQNTNK